MNVIGSRPERRWWLDRYAAMEDLARKLREFRSRTGEEVELYLDGHSSGRVHAVGGGMVVARR